MSVSTFLYPGEKALGTRMPVPVPERVPVPEPVPVPVPVPFPLLSGKKYFITGVYTLFPKS